MKEMRIGAIGIDKDSGNSVILLRDIENNRALPIWVGLPEAKAISMAVRKIRTPRPSTHELMQNSIEKLGYSIKEVVLSDIESDTYIADLILVRTGQEDGDIVTIDARPSDAIALATMCGAPVMVAPHILAQASISVNPEVDAKEEREFKEFVQSVKASDFNLTEKVELPLDDGPALD